MTRDEWLTQFARRLGVEAPSADEVDKLLRLAGIAAHASERTAAPLACYLLGRSGAPIDQGLQGASEVSD